MPEEAKIEARKALESATSLPREQKLWVEGRYQEMARAWASAGQTYQALWKFFPDNTVYGLALARVQIRAGNGKEALTTVANLRKLSPISIDARIDLADAEAAKSLGDFGRERKLAQRAAIRATEQGSKLLVARAKIEEAGAADDSGKSSEAVVLSEEAERLYDDVGDRRGLGSALNLRGTALLHQGNLVEATEAFKKSLNFGRQLGNLRRAAETLNNLAVVQYRRGNLSEALKELQESAADLRELRDQSLLATALNNIASIDMDLGKFAEARRTFEDSLVISRATGNKSDEARTLGNIASLLLRFGDARQADEIAQQSLAKAQEVADERQTAYAFHAIGECQFQQGNLDEAEKSYEHALSLRRNMKEKGLVAETTLALAEVFLERGNSQRAHEEARKAGDVFRGEDNHDEEAETWAMISRSLAAKGDVTEALKAGNHALELSRNIEDRDIRLLVMIETASVAGELGNPAGAQKTLRSALADAQTSGLYLRQLEARLALGQIETRSGNMSAGRAILLDVKRDAAMKGLGLIARKARSIEQLAPASARANGPHQ